MRWIDTHCHLDAPELMAQAAAMHQRTRASGVVHCVIPAVEVSNLATVRALAHAQGDSYCLGIHPLYVKRAAEGDLAVLDAALAQYQSDPRLVAVGEIGLDYFVPELTQSPLREAQEHYYRAQLKLARKYQLPVVVHVRRSADKLLKHLREVGQGGYRWHGIAHAFNGSLEQAQAFIDLGFKLGFGGAVTYERALQLRRLATQLPLDALVLETDAPDIPPHWLYTTAEQRAAGVPQGVNTPAELPRIAQVIAELRGMPLQDLAAATTRNACEALPKLGALLV
ncbi:TatD family hydrolase [Rhodoferax aquaticus]|uniref:TatD family deoxyribonuclease n=1 Tax=Rhodoferax aquaticus TaxID=2527691 RepID=A0A515ER08_9BURK|nr:TatD family hydrolase [Rhodoferax aquaticus]QDL55089.1 TatD family deoxyribonuclease [Rhodoferax aquaticus]